MLTKIKKEYINKIKDKLNNIEISEEQVESRIVLKLKVDKEDMGRVIGKEGRIIRSIRELIYAYAMKEHKKVTVEVEENKGE